MLERLWIKSSLVGNHLALPSLELLFIKPIFGNSFFFFWQIPSMPCLGHEEAVNNWLFPALNNRRLVPALQLPTVWNVLHIPTEVSSYISFTQTQRQTKTKTHFIPSLQITTVLLPCTLYLHTIIREFVKKCPFSSISEIACIFQFFFKFQNDLLELQDLNRFVSFKICRPCPELRPRTLNA